MSSVSPTTGGSSPSSTIALATPQNFPTGSTAKRELRRALKASKDPAKTIQTFQQERSLHTMLARSFGTTPIHEVKSERHKQSTRANKNRKTAEENAGVVAEPFRPESVLSFLGHLGVPRSEVHSRLCEALRSSLEAEISKARLPQCHGALMRLLASSWQFVAVPELRPVLVSLIKKLGEKTPPEVLQRLAERDSSSGELKHPEVLAQFSLPMRRLVWEVDWEGSHGGGSDGGGTLQSDSILASLIRPAVEEYRADEAVNNAVEQAFVGSLRERRVATPERRSNKSTSVSHLSSMTGHDTKGTKDDKKKDASVSPKSSSVAVTKIKEFLGGRPKLLGAVLNMLIAEHGQCVTEGDGVLGGTAYINCSLVSDVLLSNGQLPKPYEHVGIMAKILDTQVRNGIISDDAVAQVQGCLRIVFQSKEKSRNTEGNDKKNAEPKENTMAKSEKSESPKGDKKPVVRDDREFNLKLLRKVLWAAVDAMKKADPQGLFLNPVTDEIAPGYSDVIDEPMCILTIKEKVERGKYRNLSEYERDVQLMFENCVRYNIGPEGQWFRTEARRQQKVWRLEILKQAKYFLNNELLRRKRALDKAEADKNIQDRKRKREEQLKKEKEAKAKATAKTSAKSKAITKKEEAAKKVAALKLNEKSNDDDAITRFTAANIDPLLPSRSKKQKKDSDYPSMPCLASILLADPLVVRLFLDKILRSLRCDVLKGKTVPAAHKLIPSVMQMLDIARFSSQLCAARGRRFVVPAAGILLPKSGSEGDPDVPASLSEFPFTSLRKYTPLLARLLLDSDLDRRMATGGDLHDTKSVKTLPSRDTADTKDWSPSSLYPSSAASFSSSPLAIPRALTEGALVHLLQPGNSNDEALRSQLPRFTTALWELSNGNMKSERPFFMSLLKALLKHRAKLAHGTRDMVVDMWLQWIKGVNGEGGHKETGQCGSMMAPVHECFVMLLNEWASLGNLILPRDKLLSLSEDAVKAAEASEGNNSTSTFARSWEGDDVKFAAIKAQYLRMLNSVPGPRATKWKETVGVNNAPTQKEEDEEMPDESSN